MEHVESDIVVARGVSTHGGSVGETSIAAVLIDI